MRQNKITSWDKRDMCNVIIPTDDLIFFNMFETCCNHQPVIVWSTIWDGSVQQWGESPKCSCPATRGTMRIILRISKAKHGQSNLYQLRVPLASKTCSCHFVGINKNQEVLVASSFNFEWCGFWDNDPNWLQDMLTSLCDFYWHSPCTHIHKLYTLIRRDSGKSLNV